MRILIAVIIYLVIGGPVKARAPSVQLLTRIPLPAVSGRIDHMAIDEKNHRLFVAALGNNSLEVVDLQKNERITSLPGLREPQGVVFMPGTDQVVVANGGGGSCLVFDANTLRVVNRVNLFQDADDLRYDADGRRLYVAYGEGGIAVFDDRLGKTGNIRLPGHPEGFAIDRGDSRLFVNIPAIQSVAVLDTNKQRLTDSWRLAHARGNFPMALDQNGRLLLVGTRYPARLVGINTQSGQARFSVSIDGDADDIFIDHELHRIYVSCGAGYLDVLERTGTGSYQRLKRLPTAPGARTSLFVPDSHRLFLAVPRNGRQQAEVWVYGT